MSNPDVGPRCGECRLGLGVHNTAEPPASSPAPSPETDTLEDRHEQ